MADVSQIRVSPNDVYDIKDTVARRVATTSELGRVKPDGTTITIDQDGTIHSAGGSGTGDMLKSVYDTDNDGKVDSAENADTVSGHTVLTDVPQNALFTDTVYDDTEVRSLINGKISSSEKGSNLGVATLDSLGRVPSSQLPSYVDDVIEGYYNNLNDTFYEDELYTRPITPEESKIYISVDTNKEYRWGGTTYVSVNPSLALGETTGTAYEGSKGKALADAIENKVDKVTGKGLSTNDFTDSYKNKIDNMVGLSVDANGKVVLTYEEV